MLIRINTERGGAHGPFLFGDKVKKVEDTKEYKARLLQVFIDVGITLLVVKILAWTTK